MSSSQHNYIPVITGYQASQVSSDYEAGNGYIIGGLQKSDLKLIEEDSIRFQSKSLDTEQESSASNNQPTSSMNNQSTETPTTETTIVTSPYRKGSTEENLLPDNIVVCNNSSRSNSSNNYIISNGSSVICSGITTQGDIIIGGLAQLKDDETSIEKSTFEHEQSDELGKTQITQNMEADVPSLLTSFRVENVDKIVSVSSIEESPVRTMSAVTSSFATESVCEAGPHVEAESNEIQESTNEIPTSATNECDAKNVTNSFEISDNVAKSAQNNDSIVNNLENVPETTVLSTTTITVQQTILDTDVPPTTVFDNEKETITVPIERNINEMEVLQEENSYSDNFYDSLLSGKYYDRPLIDEVIIEENEPPEDDELVRESTPITNLHKQKDSSLPEHNENGNVIETKNSLRISNIPNQSETTNVTSATVTNESRLKFLSTDENIEKISNLPSKLNEEKPTDKLNVVNYNDKNATDRGNFTIPSKTFENNNNNEFDSFKLSSEELVAQRITDSALLSGLTLAANLSTTNPEKSLIFKGSAALHLTRDAAPADKITSVPVQQPSRIIETIVERNNKQELSYPPTTSSPSQLTKTKVTTTTITEQWSIPDENEFAQSFVDSDQFPSTSNHYAKDLNEPTDQAEIPTSVQSFKVEETEEELVKNFTNLMDEYRSLSSPTSEKYIHSVEIKRSPATSQQSNSTALSYCPMETLLDENMKAYKKPLQQNSPINSINRNVVTQNEFNVPILPAHQTAHENNGNTNFVTTRKTITETTLINNINHLNNNDYNYTSQNNGQLSVQIPTSNHILNSLQQQVTATPSVSNITTGLFQNSGNKSPTPTFGSLHRQNLLHNQYNTDASSLSPRTLSRISNLNVIMEPKLNKDGGEVIHNHPVFVKDTSKYWYKPTISREEAINMLKQKPPGTFVVRDSNSFPGAFGLALKVARPPAGVAPAPDSNGDGSSELVRHFLIEPSSKGVKLKGCSNEPVFGTLAALVYQHSITPLALPCKLLLPEYDPALSANEQQQHLNSNQALLERGAACNVTYICSFDTESLTGPEALRRATANGLEDLLRGALRAIPVHFKVSAQGITLTDNTRSLFFRRHYPAHLITFAGIDPESRAFDNNNCCQLPPSYVRQAPIFGFVARKFVSGQGNTENACHVFAELDPEQPASAVVRFITNVMMPQARSRQQTVHAV